MAPVPVYDPADPALRSGALVGGLPLHEGPNHWTAFAAKGDE